MGITEKGDSVKDYQAMLRPSDQLYSSILTDFGYTRMGIANRLPYFLLVPEAADKDAALLDGINYVSLFRDLSDQAVFDALVLLARRDSQKSFTPNLLIKSMEFTFEQAMDVIKTLYRYGFIGTTQIETDDVAQEVYTFIPSPALPAMLIFARELIDKPNHFACYCGGRKRPYLG